MPNKLNALMEKIKYTFQKPELLQQAVTHSSYANERKMNRISDYERLEFLGDAVLEMITSQFLLDKYPEKQEGELSKLRSALVCECSLAQCARELSFPDYVYLSKGERQTGGANRDSLLCDLFESVLGAIYLDGGLEPARAYVERFLLLDMEHKQLFYDAKTRLQELVQKEELGEIRYLLVDEQGPDHCKHFFVEVEIAGTGYGKGDGQSRKHAEQKAAYEALIRLEQRKTQEKKEPKNIRIGSPCT